MALHASQGTSLRIIHDGPSLSPLVRCEEHRTAQAPFNLRLKKKLLEGDDEHQHIHFNAHPHIDGKVNRDMYLGAASNM